jgi:nucleolar protein 12
VDEILGLEPSKLKFAKRKLRVQRCKVIPGGAALPKGKQPIKPAFSPRAKKTTPPLPVPLPKGDPSLGEKLAGLSKDERKAAKASNVDRLKRRLAKKKLKEGVKKAQDDQGKERKRERPRPGNKSEGKAKVVNKGRLRSERSVAKRNTKK